MSIKSKFKEMRDQYVINQVRKAAIPAFSADRIRRYRITFSGRVQKIGFRLEVCELANRLGLTGYCENLKNGDVLTELQGAENRIQYLISFMESLKRIKIRNKVIEELDVNPFEKGFQKR